MPYVSILTTLCLQLLLTNRKSRIRRSSETLHSEYSTEREKTTLGGKLLQHESSSEQQQETIHDTVKGILKRRNIVVALILFPSSNVEIELSEDVYFIPN